MDFRAIYEEIKANKKNHSEGYYNCIPFTGMGRLESYIPGIEQDTYYLITANSGIGKSKFVRYLFIHNPFEYLRDHPESDIQVHIIYFSLEESKKKIILSEISKYMYSRFKIRVSIKELQSRGRHNTLDEDTLKKVEEAEEYVNNFLKVVDIVDGIRNPTGMYKHVMKYALQIGRYYDKQGKVLTEEEHNMVLRAEGDVYKKIGYYKKDNPKHYVIVITDHIKLLAGEKDYPEGKPAMNKWSSDYCLRMRDKLGFIPVNVQQQASDKEKLEFTNLGKSIEEKLEPSLDGLGEHKLTQQDANIVLGLFAPDRYGIKTHNGYDIDVFKDTYRSCTILKDRDGVANKKLPLFFDGAIDFFKELPRANDVENLTKVYKHLKKIKK